MPSRFARPDTLTLSISHGDTLTVKRRLNSADSRKMRHMKEIPSMAEPAVVMAYLVDWTLTDDAGKRVVILGVPALALADALDALDEDTWDEIYVAVSAHEQAMKAEREAEKNGRDGERKPSAILPLRFEPAGALSGSVS